MKDKFPIILYACRWGIIGAVVGVFSGFYDALMRFELMSTMQSIAPLFKIILRLSLFVAFYGFLWGLSLLCSGLILMIFIRILSRPKDLVTFSSRWISGGIAISFFMSVFLFLGMKINSILPKLRDPKSLAGNLAFLIVLIGTTYAIYRFGSKLIIKISAFRFSFIIKPFWIIVLVILFASVGLVLFTPQGWSLGNQPSDIGVALHERPNVLLISIEALRADHLSCYGYQAIKTPNIDRIAKEGAIFWNAMAQSPWTAPSVGSFLTSMYPSMHGASSNTRLDSRCETIAELLLKNGYLTQAVLTNPFLLPLFNYTQGFCGYYHMEEMRLLKKFNGTTFYSAIAKVLFNMRDRTSGRNVTDKAILWLENNSNNKFFLWIHYFDPHIPYRKHWETGFPAYDDGYDGPIGSVFDKLRSVRNGTLKLTLADKKHILALYDSEVAFTDLQVGRLMRTLNRLDISSKTLVIITSDHGEEFWDHGGFEHGHTLYRELIRVPLIFRLPERIKPDTRIDDLVRLIDLLPSVCDLIDVPMPENALGKGLWPLLDGEEEEKGRVAFSEWMLYGPEQMSLRKRDLTCIMVPSERKYSLYDLSTDPQETIDISEDRLDESQTMKKLLEREIGKAKSYTRRIGLKKDKGKVKIDEATKERLKSLGYIK